MEEQFVPYHLAAKMKELGFDELCFGVYRHSESNNLQILDAMNLENWNNLMVTHGFMKAALWQQAFDWFRESQSLYYMIIPDKTYSDGLTFNVAIKRNLPDYPYDLYSEICRDSDGVKNYSSYRESRLKALEAIIDICSKSKM